MVKVNMVYTPKQIVEFLNEYEHLCHKHGMMLCSPDNIDVFYKASQDEVSRSLKGIRRLVENKYEDKEDYRIQKEKDRLYLKKLDAKNKGAA